MSSRWLRLLAAGTAVGFVLGLCAPDSLAGPVNSGHAPAPAAFGIQPATKGHPDSRAALTYSVTPGASMADQVAIVNIGTKPVTVAVYATDATSGADGSFGLLARASRPHDAGTWISVGGSGSVHVPARTKRGPSYVIVPLRLRIPAGATPGDHAGGVVVSLQGSAVNKQGLRVGLDQRVALRVYTRVSGPIHAGLAIEGLHVGYAGPGILGNPVGHGALTLDYRVHNTGNVLLGAVQSATVTSWLGARIEVKGLPLVPPLLPGASVTVHRRVAGVFPGVRVTATVHLHPVPPSGSADPKLADVTAETTLWAVPWALLALVLLLLAAVGYAAWRRLRRRPEPVGAPTSHRKTKR